MNLKRPSVLFSVSFNFVFFLLAILPPSLAGPALAHRNGDCVHKCGSKWGWPGYPSENSTTTTSSPSPSPPLTPAASPSPSPPLTPAASTPKSTPTAISSSTSANTSNSSASTSSSDIDAYLLAHNSIRAQHGAADLTWSVDAASKAQEWANKCNFVHSQGALGAFGENLAAGTGDYTIPMAVKAWTDESSQYDPANPQASHFTQVVWKATTQVGCAVATCSGIFDASFGPAQFYVCEYSPPGNVEGEFSQNVQA